MQLKSKLAVAGAGLLSLGGVGTGVALASPGATAAPAHTVRVVNASQVTPQAPAANAPAAAPVAPAAPSPAAAPATNQAPTPADPDNVQTGDQTTPDSPTATVAEADTASANEATTAESDGPGGHQDPPGNVDHQSTTEQ